eukprot:CAMPEP_0181517656 /NCGR_PEP_ID=MMETSP1110-20121109/64828_1 /TAXON_ID=174948 /ORGANISM="Symbiodinium sp., Strain CCMP421" /LENGTH=40 /DNA_ID= /DNA_START= /DNA_END= /DNA_ORIENTATION=
MANGSGQTTLEQSQIAGVLRSQDHGMPGDPCRSFHLSVLA